MKSFFFFVSSERGLTKAENPLIVFGNNFKDHMQRLDLVLQRMAEAGLKLKPEKCQLLKSEVAFLGHLVSDKGIQQFSFILRETHDVSTNKGLF
jgi:hypothetical protein